MCPAFYVDQLFRSREKDLCRLFLASGMGHCQGSAAACSNVDWLDAMVNWLEKGVPPVALKGAHIEKGQTTRTRPICVFPTSRRILLPCSSQE
jgi:hypothetical protein